MLMMKPVMKLVVRVFVLLLPSKSSCKSATRTMCLFPGQVKSELVGNRRRC